MNFVSMFWWLHATSDLGQFLNRPFNCRMIACHSEVFVVLASYIGSLEVGIRSSSRFRSCILLG